MADTIFTTVLPPTKAVDNLDTTFSLSVKDVNSAALLAAVTGVSGNAAVPAQNSAANILSRDVVGNKTDTAVTTVGVVASIIAYVKGILNQLAHATYGLSAIKTLIDTLTGYVDTEVAAIKAVTDAEETLTETGGTITGTNAQQDLYIANAPAGIMTPVGIFVDLDNMAADDTIEVRIKYRIKAGGTMKDYEYYEKVGVDGGSADAEKGVYYALHPTRFGVEVTLVQTLATTSYKTFDWEVFYGV